MPPFSLVLATHIVGSRERGSFCEANTLSSKQVGGKLVELWLHTLNVPDSTAKLVQRGK